MEALDQFTIPVSGLRDGLHEFDFSIGDEFFKCFEESPITHGQIEVRLRFDKQPDMYELAFDIKGTIVTPCDRCLEDFDHPIDDLQHLLVKFDEEEWEDADVVYIAPGTPSVNVAKYIYEFINLAIPMVKTHEKAGERCNPEMLKFLKRQDAGEKPRSNPAWDALRDINFEN
ncbi:MAG: DUF177 domain-containing protein [Saprospiraceae bacterium]